MLGIAGIAGMACTVREAAAVTAAQAEAMSKAGILVSAESPVGPRFCRFC